MNFMKMDNKKNFTNPDNEGFYGDFGGAFVPEMLQFNIDRLRENYLKIMNDSSFQQEFMQLLTDYAGRPTSLYEAKRISQLYGMRVFLKREDLNHTGAHKITNAIGQVLMAERLGLKRIIAETGAGQHGVAAATVCALKGLECVVYMGETDIKRQAPNVARMKMLGATVVPVLSGNKTLKDAVNEAISDWIGHPSDTFYIIGSVVGPHPYPDMVARFQSIISKEAKTQYIEKTGKTLPDAVVACVGGGSNAAGMFYHFLDDPGVLLFGAEADGKGANTHETAATINNGKAGILHGSLSYLMQTPDGQVIEPYSISAGLDYPGVGPLHAMLHQTGRCTYLPVTDEEALEAAFQLTRLEGIIPALESAHALALLKKADNLKGKDVIVCLSGRGDKDIDTYFERFGFDKL